jgi:hypothetical protein
MEMLINNILPNLKPYSKYPFKLIDPEGIISEPPMI